MTTAIPINQLNAASKLAIEIAQKHAKDANHPTFGPPHLLMALLNSRVGITSFLSLIDKDLSYLKGWAQYRIDEYESKGLPSDEPEADTRVLRSLDVARTFMLMFNHKRIEPLAMLCALVRPEVGFPKGQLGSLRLTEDELVQAILNDSTIQQAIEKDQNGDTAAAKSATSHSPANTKMFLQYCVDKTALADQGKIDPIFGRDKEIGQMENNLSRRTKPNVIIIGEPGVGKTALVDGFALKIAQGEVSEYFKSAKLYELDIGALVAGASYKGEVEDRLKKILMEVKRMDNVILFIDEIHIILDEKGGAAGVANLLKPELARGDINVIGATTIKEYKMYIEKDPAFNRRFGVVQVGEPDLLNAMKMIRGLKGLFEDHHKFTMDEEAVVTTVKLAKRYFPERFLPDSAIDLMDRTMAAYRILEDNIDARIEKVKNSLAELPQEASAEDWALFWSESENVLSPLAFENIVEEKPESDSSEDWSTYVNKVLGVLEQEAKNKKETISKSDVAMVVAMSTGIPVGSIGEDEQAKLMGLEDYIMARVIGQDHAASIISQAIRRSRSGVKEKGKPIGSFLFVGPTGTGKTELAKTITENLFDSKDNMIRFDMADYMDKSTVSKLKGSAPGLVGYGEGGVLVNKIRSKPYSVVLFDEIEKAHPDIFQLFLPVLDEGYLEDTLGKIGNFADSVIIFTSNADQEWLVDQFEKGVMPEENEIRDRLAKVDPITGKQHFKPEFLNRLDAIIPFRPLSKEDLLKIFDIQLRRLAKLLAEQKIQIEVSDAARKYLTDEGYSPKFGARPLKRVIDNYLGDKFSEMIISGQVGEGQQIRVDYTDDGLSFKVG